MGGIQSRPHPKEGNQVRQNPQARAYLHLGFFPVEVLAVWRACACSTMITVTKSHIPGLPVRKHGAFI